MNGFRYHYVNEGEGEPVVMLHGNPTWSFYYRSLIDKLSPGCQTVAVDHLGCGKSDKPSKAEYDYKLKNRVDDFEKLMDNLDFKQKITLVVHDWGGMIGMAYALRHPEKIGRIVITNTSGFFPAGENIPFRLWIMRYIRPFAKPATLGLNLFSAAAIYMAAKKPLAQAVKKGLTAPYNSWKNRIATYEFVQDIPLAPGHPSYDLVNEVDENLTSLAHIPMLICWGKHDFIFTPGYYKEWVRRFPDAEAHFFETAGHYILEDEPEKVTALIHNFIGKTPLP